MLGYLGQADSVIALELEDETSITAVEVVVTGGNGRSCSQSVGYGHRLDTRFRLRHGSICK